MITEALQHCRGIGPVRLQALHAAGVRSWYDIVSFPDRVPEAWRDGLVSECQKCLEALASDDIWYFVRNLAPTDRWRILPQFLNEASFFDIETTGLEFDCTVTVIICWHAGQLHTFVEGENLDDFLDLLEEIRLLISFNGSSFDVPKLLDCFHIPDLPCPHLDLRWPCYHRELQGGLKQVAATLGIERPRDLADVDGDLAVRLWSQWDEGRDNSAREQLIRYCAADVLLLRPVSEYLAGLPLTAAAELWKDLPGGGDHCQKVADDGQERRRELSMKFGDAAPLRLRTRRRR